MIEWDKKFVDIAKFSKYKTRKQARDLVTSKYVMALQ